jgi:hypothetical protein
LATKFLAAALAAALALASGCKRRDPIPVGQTEEEAPRMATVLHVADPRADQQLLSGFHSVEQNAWRWTEDRFSVSLRPPRDASQKGAVLQLKFNVPEVLATKLGAIALEASIGGVALGKESYTQAGEYTYSREAPAKLLASDAVQVDFTLDKHLPPSASDIRKLGVIVTTIGFEAK